MDKTEETSPNAQDNVTEFSVSELSFAIKQFIEEGFAYVRVRGELGRISRPGSGHVYLDLKDEKAVLSGVIWRGQAARLAIQPEQGMEVVATGRLTTYPGQSRYQIVIDALEPAGEGALLAQLEKLKKKLATEGLFEEGRKKPIPFLPRVIGIVTSPTGAVIRDMMHGFTERFPVHVIVWPVRVQGETCGAEVAAAIRGFNAFDETAGIAKPDLLIVGRGGGSLEDLWGFNDEQVARAAADSDIPLISAVGHETDWTIIDLVADARAPTPTKAAEWAVPVYADLAERLAECRLRLAGAQRRSLQQYRMALTAAARGIPRANEIFAVPRQRFDAAALRLPRALQAGTHAHSSRLTRISAGLRPSILQQRLRLAGQALNQISGRASRSFVAQVSNRRTVLEARSKLLGSLSHKGVLQRGFALVRDDKGKMVRSASAPNSGQALDVEFADGHVPVTVTGSKLATPKRPKPGKKDGPQGDLF